MANETFTDIKNEIEGDDDSKNENDSKKDKIKFIKVDLQDKKKYPQPTEILSITNSMEVDKNDGEGSLVVARKSTKDSATKTQFTVRRYFWNSDD